jgi:ParB family chromosome partitioning protein
MMNWKGYLPTSNSRDCSAIPGNRPNDHGDLDAVEEAEAYQMLAQRFGLSQDQIATRVGKARPTITNALRLLKLPPAVTDMLRDGRLTAGQARPLLGLESEEAQVRMAERAVGQGLSAREVERLVSPPERPAKKKRQREVDVHTSAAEEKLTRRLQARVEIHRRGKGGTLRVHFHNEEELMRLYDLLVPKGERS